METQKFLVTLEKELVNKAGELQKKLTGSVNLSGLLNKILREWNKDTENFLELRDKPVFDLKKTATKLKELKNQVKDIKEEDSKKQ